MKSQPNTRVGLGYSSISVWGADVTRYASHGQALAAQQGYLDSEAMTGVRRALADGTQIIVYPTSDVYSTKVTASAVRDRLLVTVEVFETSVQRPTAGTLPRIYTQAPLIRDLLVANATRIDEASFPWWG